jgi:Flp pilus assembly protein TadD
VEHPVGPTLRRAPGRRLAILLIAALVGALATVAIAAWTATDEPAGQSPSAAASADPLPGRPPLLVLPLPETAALTGEARRTAVEDLARSRPDDLDVQLALVAVDLQFERREEAAAALERAAAIAPDDPRVAAARLTLGYDPASPQATIDALATLVEQQPDVPLARFQLGVAQLWAGHADTAQKTLLDLRDREGEGTYASAADDLLHPGMAPGYPPYFTSFDPDAGGIEQLQAIAKERATDVKAQLQLGAALAGAGRRADAAEAFARALTLDPNSVEAQVARAVNAFDKDDPSGTFSILGPLAADHPDDPSARFALAVCLLWLRDVERARSEFRQVQDDAPGTRLARLAAALEQQAR